MNSQSSNAAIRLGDEPWIERTLYLQVPKDAPGVSFPGDWDPMGMRATVSRDMSLENVFVPDDAEALPPGLFGAMYNAFPHLFLTFSAIFLALGAPIYRLLGARDQALAEALNYSNVAFLGSTTLTGSEIRFHCARIVCDARSA